MPVVKVELVGKQDAAMKKELMTYIAEQISTVSNTPMQNIYVFINEWDAENVLRKDPVITLDWVAKPDRDAAEKAECAAVPPALFSDAWLPMLLNAGSFWLAS